MVSDDSRECVIIDCGALYPEECEAINQYLREQQLKPVHLLATHGHLDHNFGNAHLFQQYGLKVEICADDQQLVEHLPQQAAALFGMEISDDQPPVGSLLKQDDVIRFGHHDSDTRPFSWLMPVLYERGEYGLLWRYSVPHEYRSYRFPRRFLATDGAEPL